MLEYRSTRFRLTAWGFIMLSATLAVMGVSGWFAMRASLYRAIDDDLENRLLDVEKFLQSQPDLSHEGVRRELGIRSSLGMGATFYMVFDDLGNELYRSPQVGEYNLDVPPENPGDKIRFLKEGSYVANQNSLIHSLRTASKRINVRGSGIVIEVVEPLNGVDLALLYFERFLLIGVPVLLGLGTFGAFWITRRALAPVDRITMDARSISANNLSGRLAVPVAVDELRRLSETLNQMLDRIETSFKAIRQFTADASHELRAPMTLIQAAADFSLRRDRTKEDLQEAMGRILRESRRTTALVDDLLMIARSDSDPAAFERNPIDLSSLIEDVTMQAKTLAEGKHIKIVPSIPPNAAVIEGDELSIRRLFMTLVDNAVKYTPEHGSIWINLNAEGSQAVIKVRDTGLGIAREDLPRVFDRFWRADKVRSRDEGGTGLGLSIAKG
ncbi:MAG TPA: ATP-binding protein, partial [Terriglobia bacterium]|nr:ATP-binding protein [Terriglobia bacterium]